MTKKKWLGALLNSFVPGLGQFYARRIKKGLLVWILFFVVVFSLRFIAYNFQLFLVSIALIIGYYLYLIISGYRDVDKNREYQPSGFDKWYVYVLIVLINWALVSAIKGRRLDAITPVNFARIPTPAMDPTLQVGDILAFRKVRSVERNDVTIFWFPDDIKTMYVKRCAGLPGDSLQITGSKVMVNGRPQPNVPVKLKYIVTTDGSEINPRILEKNRLGENDYFKISADTYQFFLTAEQAQNLRAFKFLRSVELSISTEGEREAMIYPRSVNLDWNTDFFGPIYIPRKGDRIDLTDSNIDLYLKCIALENESVQKDKSGLIINGQLTTTYEFKDNYFFMMGDNRHNSLDSRYWGLLPERLIIGKAIYLYWGQTSDRIGKEII